MPPKPRPGGKRKPTTSADGPDSRIVWAVIAGAVVLVAVGGFYLLGTGDEAVAAADVRTAMDDAGCSLQEVEALPGNQHTLTPGETSDAWNTDPPTSGPHSPETAIYGAYDEPVEQSRLVHNLEHGAIFIQYGDGVPDETVAELKGFYDDHQPGTVLAPYPSLGDEVALGAWTVSGGKGTAYLATCPGFDATAFTAFFDELQFRGPERFSPDAMLPGNP